MLSQCFHGGAGEESTARSLCSDTSLTGMSERCAGVRSQAGRTTELVRVNLSSQAPTRYHQSARRHGSCPPPRDKAAGRHGV